MGRGRLGALVSYGRRVYDLGERLGALRDGREEPLITARAVGTSVLFAGLLRIRSFNALEPMLSEPTFIRLCGGAPPQAKDLGSADTLARALRSFELVPAHGLCMGIVAQAERNKVLREGWVGAQRYVALDGWEPISSRGRHCDGCLVRQIPVKQRDGTTALLDEYYHRFVVAMLIDERLDLVLDYEPLLPADLRPGSAGRNGQDEGELTAARRLLRRVKQSYGWIDVVVGDGLYPNGPFLTDVKQLRMGAVVVLRKQTDEPLKDALAIWGSAPAAQVVHADGPRGRERIELWDCPHIQTLQTYQGPIRVVRGRVAYLDEPAREPSTWCVAVTGSATRLTPAQVLRVARGRWHIENTGFHQWTTRWRFGHVFVHDAHAMQALFWIFFAAFNLLTLFLYRQLCCYGRDRGKDTTRTISRLIDEMLAELARLDRSPWDTS